MFGKEDGVASAQVGQSVGELAIGIELPGQVERAHPPVDHQWNVCSPSGALDELGIEAGVVGGEHAALEPSGELGERIACRRCRTQRSAGDAVDVARADAVPPAARAYERRPAFDHGAGGIDGDHGDLQHVIAFGTQS